MATGMRKGASAMVVMVLEKVPTSLRGELTRWLLELKTGVFVGSVSGLVRDKLWEKVCANIRDGGCILAYNSNTEQGYVLRFWGKSSRLLTDFDGLTLVTIPQKTSTNKVQSEQPSYRLQGG